MTKRIALLGLSGVGKSTLIRRLHERIPILHLQASALIMAEQTYRAQEPDSSEALRTGAVIDNQALMIAAFRRAADATEMPVVFDGHSIIDGRNGLVRIPAVVFAALGLNAIFYLSADPHVIFRRRSADIGRERPKRDAEILADHQRFAYDVTQRIAEEIGCKFIPINDGDIESIVSSLN